MTHATRAEFTYTLIDSNHVPDSDRGEGYSFRHVQRSDGTQGYLWTRWVACDDNGQGSRVIGWVGVCIHPGETAAEYLAEATDSDISDFDGLDLWDLIASMRQVNPPLDRNILTRSMARHWITATE